MRRWLPIGFLFLAAGGFSHAVPPLVTDDAEVAKKRTFELYVGYDYESTAGEVSRTVPAIELDYGVTDRWELTLEIPYLSQAGVQGWGDMELETKFVLLEETKKRPAVALGFDWKLTNGSVARGLGTGRLDYGFLLPVQKTWGRFTASACAGFTFVGNPRVEGVTERRYNSWFFGCAQQFKCNERTTLLSEIYAQRAEEPGQPNRLAANIGIQREIFHDFSLQASIGKSLREASHGGPEFHAYVGVHWAFDAPWKREKHALKK